MTVYDAHVTVSNEYNEGLYKFSGVNAGAVHRPPGLGAPPHGGLIAPTRNEQHQFGQVLHAPYPWRQGAPVAEIMQAVALESLESGS